MKPGPLSLCAAAASLALARPAQAGDETRGPFKVSVSYEAPAECPGLSAFMTLLAGHLEAEDDAPLYTQVAIRGLGSLYRLKLTVYVSALPLRSEESANSCEELVRLAALMTAMARAEPAPPLESPALLIDSEEAPEAAMAVSLPAESQELDGPVAAAAGEPTDALSPPGPRWLAAGHVQTGWGLLPGVGLGMGPLLELAWPSFAARAAASWWLSRDVVPAADLDSMAPVTLTLQSLDLAGCWTRPLYAAPAQELSFDACAVVSGYRLNAATQAREAAVSYRAAAGFSAGVTWTSTSGLHIGAELGLSELGRPFRIRSAPWINALYESRTSHVRLELTAGFRFGGGGG